MGQKITGSDQTINSETKKPPPVKQNRSAGKPICPVSAVRYLYQPGEQEGAGGAMRRTRYGVSVFTRCHHIVLQGIRVYYLMPPAPQRGFMTEELLIVPADTQTRMS